MSKEAHPTEYPKTIGKASEKDRSIGVLTYQEILKDVAETACMYNEAQAQHYLNSNMLVSALMIKNIFNIELAISQCEFVLQTLQALRD